MSCNSSNLEVTTVFKKVTLTFFSWTSVVLFVQCPPFLVGAQCLLTAGTGKTAIRLLFTAEMKVVQTVKLTPLLELPIVALDSIFN